MRIGSFRRVHEAVAAFLIDVSAGAEMYDRSIAAFILNEFTKALSSNHAVRLCFIVMLRQVGTNGVPPVPMALGLRAPATLLDDIAARVFEVGGTKTRHAVERRIEDLAQGRLRRAVTRHKLE
jgi:hypothetical protein